MNRRINWLARRSLCTVSPCENGASMPRMGKFMGAATVGYRAIISHSRMSQFGRLLPD